jgi:hypothetical protein
MVGDRHAMRVASQILEDMFWTADEKVLKMIFNENPKRLFPGITMK